MMPSNPPLGRSNAGAAVHVAHVTWRLLALTVGPALMLMLAGKGYRPLWTGEPPVYSAIVGPEEFAGSGHVVAA